MKPEMCRADYPHVLSVPTRWMDNDVYGHVNNAQHYSFFDSTINQYLIAEGGLDIHASGVIALAVETHCQFMKPLAFPEVIDVGLRVARIGESSVRYELAVFRKGDPDAAAAGYFVHVFVDREARRSVPIPHAIRGALERLLRTDRL